MVSITASNQFQGVSALGQERNEGSKCRKFTLFHRGSSPEGALGGLESVTEFYYKKEEYIPVTYNWGPIM